MYEETVYSKPSVGEESEVYLGDRMLIQQVGEWKECITPLKTYKKKTWGVVYLYKRDEPICKEGPSSKHYMPTYFNAIGSTSIYQLVSWKGTKGKFKMCQVAMGIKSECIKNLNENDIQAGETFIYSLNSFQQTIEYSGKKKDILKFTYSEYTDGFAREAFSRDFQVDLSEGNIAAFKGAIIEIINADNIKIVFKVIRNFNSDL
ncbi:MAG: hypothetical protein P8M71_01435 [Pseudomonadales bacterium]|nr:hypothetical protein [Pseudomonadales bacterium]